MLRLCNVGVIKGSGSCVPLCTIWSTSDIDPKGLSVQRPRLPSTVSSNLDHYSLHGWLNWLTVPWSLHLSHYPENLTAIATPSLDVCVCAERLQPLHPVITLGVSDDLAREPAWPRSCILGWLDSAQCWSCPNPWPRTVSKNEKARLSHHPPNRSPRDCQGDASALYKSLAKDTEDGLHRSPGFLWKQQLVSVHLGKLLLTKEVEARGRTAGGRLVGCSWKKQHERKALWSSTGRPGNP